MHIKKIMLTAAMAATSICANAQMLSYKTTVNDPDSYKRTTLYLELFNVDTYLNFSLGSSAKIETMVGERLMPWAQLKYSWEDASTHHVVTGFPTNAGGLKKQEIIDIGTAYFLMNRNVKKRTKVVLSSTSFGGHTHTRYIMVPALTKKLLGVEGGIYMNRRALEFGDKSHNKFHYKSTDGTYDAPIGEVGGSGTGQPSGEYYKPLSMTHIFSMYGGLHYRKINNVTISSDDYGEKSNRNMTDMYLDVMLAPAVTIANVIDDAGKEWVIAPQSGSIRHLGWRAGYTHHNSQHTSFSYNFEFGQKPGPVMGDDFMSNGSYISLGMGLNIGSNKYVHLKSKRTSVPKPDTK